jgi:hypothetical protein
MEIQRTASVKAFILFRKRIIAAKNAKTAKEEETKRFLDVGWFETHYVFPDLKFVAAKVHQ